MKGLFVVFMGFAAFAGAGCALKRPPISKTADLPPLETGDLIFLDLLCGPLCDAIEDVTLKQFKTDGPRLSHVGIVERVGKQLYVLEAWPRGGVQTVSLEHFLDRVPGGLNQSDGFYLGRLKPDYRSLGEAAVVRIRKHLGWPYDDTFEWDPTRFYCSELVSFGFTPESRRLVGKGRALFLPRAMFFGEPDSDVFKVWKSYYHDLGQPVPSQDPGLSPLGIYLEGKRRLFIDDDVRD